LAVSEISLWRASLCTNSEAGMRDQYPFMAPNQCVGETLFGSEGHMIMPHCIS